MPFEITLDLLPGGYSVTAARKGEMVQIQTQGFTSTEDGEDFITKVRGLPDKLLQRLPPGCAVSPSQIDHLLAIIRRDKTATLYINELPILVQTQINRDIKAGMPVGKDDVADIVALDLPGVTIPDDAGVVFVFSVGWRRGFFYDVEPLCIEPATKRNYDLKAAFGQC